MLAMFPVFQGAHSQGETLDELNANLREVIEMLLEGYLTYLVAADCQGYRIDH
jgi:predicted RNase H-like HicB family nuclease